MKQVLTTHHSPLFIPKEIHEGMGEEPVMPFSCRAPAQEFTGTVIVCLSYDVAQPQVLEAIALPMSY